MADNLRWIKYMVIKAGWRTALWAPILLLVSCGPQADTVPMPAEADLVIFTAQDEAVYEPVIKEFEERTNLKVRVENGSSEDMLRRLGEETDKGDNGKGSEKRDEASWDLVFGVGIETLEQSRDYWQPYESPEAGCITEAFQCSDSSWTSFSALPLVIMYNTNVVTYRELPTGWGSLLEPRWKGRVAFMDPGQSDIYSAALVAAVYTCDDSLEYLKQLMENLDYHTLRSLSEVNEGILDGRYSLGVTMEESAQALRTEGADIDYIYPKEGITAIPDGTAILKDCAHRDAAEEFLDFTISMDVQRILVSDLNRRSVRSDVPPLPGLSPISRLPLIEMDLQEMSEKKAMVSEEWNRILSSKTQDKEETP